MTTKGIELLGQILLRQGAVRHDDLDTALAKQAALPSPRLIGAMLHEQGALSVADLARGLAQQWNLPLVDQIEPERLDRSLVMQFPLDFLKKHHAIPLSDGNGGVVIAVANPLDVKAFDSVANVLGRHCSRAVSTPELIEEALSRCFYHDEAGTSAIVDELSAEDDVAEITSSPGAEDLLSVAGAAPMVKLANALFFQAVRSRASDIHIEPYEREVKVRFRIDGVLHNRFTMPREHVAALTSRLKIMAHLNIAERRLPQDGRCRIRIGEREVDIRVSTIPTSGGERVVLRLLDKATAKFGLSELGFSPETAKKFRRFVHMPHGIILLTGPTGSGKTTTLYSALSEINTEERNILTVEDPIEYDLPGVGQMHVRPRINLTFANCLRHILRQDPDVIMVGEIRDSETAEIAIQAALTGHLVFSTLHTNDAPSAFTRLLDMGIEPYLVSSSVIAVMAQRLVRMICPECAYTDDATADECIVLELPAAKVKRGRGCKACLDTGYLGRTVIVEMLPVDDAVRDLITRQAGAGEIRTAAMARGMQALRNDGLRKVLAGETSVEEVLRVSAEDAVVNGDGA